MWIQRWNDRRIRIRARIPMMHDAWQLLGDGAKVWVPQSGVTQAPSCLQAACRCIVQHKAHAGGCGYPEVTDTRIGCIEWRHWAAGVLCSRMLFLSDPRRVSAVCRLWAPIQTRRWRWPWARSSPPLVCSARSLWACTHGVSSALRSGVHVGDRARMTRCADEYRSAKEPCCRWL